MSHRRTREHKLGCNYQGFDFGARYIDSICMDGQLYDADACDDEGNLYKPMEYIACPQCNHREWRNDRRGEIEEKGWIAADDGEPRRSNPFTDLKHRLRFPRDRRWLKRHWDRGFRAWAKEKDHE